MLVIGAGALYFIVRAVQERSADAAFAARAVAVEAAVISADEMHGWRSRRTFALVSFTPPGRPLDLHYDEVSDCAEDRLSPDAESVRVLYDPRDETDVRIRGCVDQDFKGFLVLAALLLLVEGMFVFYIWSGRRTAKLIAKDAAIPGPRRTEPIVIMQRRKGLNALFVVLVSLVGFALVRGHMGAETMAGRVVTDAFMGTILVGIIASWVGFLARPEMITVGRDVISFTHRGSSTSTELRRPGSLYVDTKIRRKGGRRRYLKIEGSDEAIPLDPFSWGEVVRALVAMGWRVPQDSDTFGIAAFVPMRQPKL